MSKTFGKIGSGVGFSKTSGRIKKRITREHTQKDFGKAFVDNYGKSYIVTPFGRIF